MNNLYGFSQEEILPYHKSKHAKRNIEVQNKLRLFAESKQIEDELKEASEKNQKQMLFESIAANSYNKRSTRRRTRLAEDNQIRKNLSNKVLVNYLTEMVISGLVFDEYFTNRYRDSIKNEMNTIFSEMFKENILTESSFIKCKNILVNDAYYNLQECIDTVIKNRDNINIFNEEVIDNILQEAKKSKDLSDEVAANVKEKVTDTLETEKKISKKKKEEKEKDEEETAEDEEEAADSLDSDVDEDPDAGTNDDSDEDMNDETDEDSDDDSEGEEDMEEDSENDEESDTDSEDSDNDSEGDEDMDDEDDDLGDADKLDDDSDDDSESSEEEMDNLSDDSENSEESEDDDASDESEDPTANTDPEDVGEEASTDSTDASSSGSGELTLTVKTNGTSVTVSANKSESVNYLNLFGKSRYKSRNEKTFFRNILENKLVESVNLLSEGSNPISKKNPVNMDNVLAESIITYTLLETLHTSRLLELSQKQINSLNKMMNFKRK